MVPAHREIEITAEFIPFSVIRTYVEAPRPIGQHSQDPKANPYTTFSASVDMSSATNNYYNANNINDSNREVYIIVDKPVVTSVPQVESPHTFFTVSRHNNSRGSFFGDREESERDSQREDGWYTTCDKHDHPHFYVRLSKAKMIRDKNPTFSWSAFPGRNLRLVG